MAHRGKRALVHSVQRLSHITGYLTVELTVTESLTDWCQAALSSAARWQFQLGEQKVATAHSCHCALCSVFFFFLGCFPFYSYRLYFLYMYTREALMVRSILLNSLSFFKKKKMLLKCINLFVGRTFSRASACGRSNTNVFVWNCDRTSTGELNRLAQSCSVVSHVQEGIHFSGHHNASKSSWKPATIQSFCYAYRSCTRWRVSQMACFYALGCLLMFVKLVRGSTSLI